MLAGFGAADVADQRSPPQHHDAVAATQHVAHVVADHDHRNPLLREPGDELQDLLGLLDAERGGGLVQEHDVTPPGHRPGNRDGLALAA